MKNEVLKRLLSSITLIPIVFFFIIKGSTFFLVFLAATFFTTTYEWYQMSKKTTYYLPGVIFLLISFISAYLFRSTWNLYEFLTLIIICIFTDIGGYIFGKLFNGPKLTKISPNKTYAGVFGGFIFAIIAYTIFVQNLDVIKFLTYNEKKTPDIFYVLIVSSISQLGDLTISYFKRKFKIKNTGNLLPGHGGILDRIDGIIFVIPIVYLFKILN